MSKIAEDAIEIIERIMHTDHQEQHNINHSQKNNGIMDLNSNYDIIFEQTCC